MTDIAVLASDSAMARPAHSRFAILSALLVREFHIKTKGYGLVGFAAAICEPIIHVMIMVIWHTAIRFEAKYGSSILLFVATGVYPHFFFVHLSSGFRGPIKANSLNKRFGPETNLDIYYVHAFIMFIGHCIVGIVLFGIIYFVDTYQAAPSDYCRLFEGVAALTGLGLGIGLINATLNQVIRFWHFFYEPFSRLMMLFSGIYFIPEFLDKRLQNVIIWNPLLHGMKVFRLGFYPSFPQLMLREQFLWGFVIASIVVGFAIERCARRFVEEKALT